MRHNNPLRSWRINMAPPVEAPLPEALGPADSLVRQHDSAQLGGQVQEQFTVCELDGARAGAELRQQHSSNSAADAYSGNAN